MNQIHNSKFILFLCTSNLPFPVVFACSAAKSQRSHSGGRWTTGWSRWLWPMTETPTCRSLPADQSKLQTFILLQGERCRYGSPWCRGCCGLFFLRVCGQPREDTSDRKTDLKESLSISKPWCCRPSLLLISILILCFTRAFMNSSIFFWKFAFAGNILIPVIGESRHKTEDLPLKAQISLCLSDDFITAEWNPLFSWHLSFFVQLRTFRCVRVAVAWVHLVR